MGKPFGKASRRTFARIGTLVPFPCWNSLGVMSSDTLKFSKQPPSEALKGGLPVSVLQLSGLLTIFKCLKNLFNYFGMQDSTRMIWNDDSFVLFHVYPVAPFTPNQFKTSLQ
jgi:hypothetical protein